MGDLRLPEHVRFCEIGERRIFLDLFADRYFSLPPALDAAFSSAARGLEPGAPFEVDALRRIGLFVAAPAGNPMEPTRHPRPDRSFVEEADFAGGGVLAVLAEVLILVARARRAVKRKRLAAEILASRHPPSSAYAPRDQRDHAVGAFLRARGLVPIAPNCLYDSLALRRFLLRRGIGVDLVIGVKLHPFAAHCWAQDGTTVLNDSLGSARDFVPILVE